MKEKGLYKLSGTCVKNEVNSMEQGKFELIETKEVCNNKKLEKQQETTLLWYMHLGHLNFDALYELSLQCTIDRLSQLSKISPVCDIYQARKQITKKFGRSMTRSVEPLVIIHYDLCDLFKCTSFNRAKYFVTFIDDHSRKIWVSLIKTKDRVLDEFVKFKAFVENQIGRRIKIL